VFINSSVAFSQWMGLVSALHAAMLSGRTFLVPGAVFDVFFDGRK
jgi:hypothetical protein